MRSLGREGGPRGFWEFGAHAAPRQVTGSLGPPRMRSRLNLTGKGEEGKELLEGQSHWRRRTGLCGVGGLQPEEGLRKAGQGTAETPRTYLAAEADGCPECLGRAFGAGSLHLPPTGPVPRASFLLLALPSTRCSVAALRRTQLLPMTILPNQGWGGGHSMNVRNKHRVLEPTVYTARAGLLKGGWRPRGGGKTRAAGSAPHTLRLCCRLSQGSARFIPAS